MKEENKEVVVASKGNGYDLRDIASTVLGALSFIALGFGAKELYDDSKETKKFRKIREKENELGKIIPYEEHARITKDRHDLKADAYIQRLDKAIEGVAERKAKDQEERLNRLENMLESVLAKLDKQEE